MAEIELEIIEDKQHLQHSKSAFKKLQKKPLQRRSKTTTKTYQKPTFDSDKKSLKSWLSIFIFQPTIPCFDGHYYH